MPPRSRARDAPSEAQIFKATYSGVPVYEMICKGVAVMRRRSDGWLNATQILKVAGLDKPQRTRVLEREVQKGEHEKVQGGYGKYQGTWVPMERGMGLARQYNVQPLLQPIADFVPASNSPPLAPKHATLPSVKTKRKPGPAEGNVMATRSSRRGAPSGAANVEDAEGEDEHMVDAVAESDPDSRRSSPPASGDGSMTSSPSEASSSSRTPSPIASEAVAMNNVHGSNQNGMDWTRNDMDAVPSGSRGRPPYPESGPLSSYPQPPPQHYPGANYIQPSHSQYPQTGRDSRRYGDIILEYFVSDTSQIPGILINPPPDFDPNMAIDDDGHTALHWACAMGRVRVVKLLLTAGADIFKVNKGGQTPLMRSVMFANNYDVRKFPELYELLHRSTLNIDNFNRTVFHHIVDVAMSKGKTHAARYYMETILNRLADFPQELADIINFQDEDGETALTLAARCRSKRLVKLLIDHGADPKIANGDAKTTEDYILEDERFRYSPVMRGQSLSFKMPFGNAGPGSSHGAYGPRLHNSTAAQHASGKCTQQMAMLLDSLAASFDQELADKERDLNQAHGLLSNIQAEILESQRAVQALKTQAGALEPAKAELQRLEEELKAKMGKRYRLGWEKWLKDEETRERSWKGTAGATGLGMGIGFDMNGTVPGMEQAADRRTRTGNGTEGDNDLEDLYNWVESIQGQGSNTVPTSVESLRKEVEGHRTKRQKVFDDFVKHSAEAGTGGRMAEYRRLIGAGCGGVPPSEVDNVIGILLETLESDESTLAAIGLSVAPNANPASSSQTDSQMTLT